MRLWYVEDGDEGQRLYDMLHQVVVVENDDPIDVSKPPWETAASGIAGRLMRMRENGANLLCAALDIFLLGQIFAQMKLAEQPTVDGALAEVEAILRQQKPR